MVAGGMDIDPELFWPPVTDEFIWLKCGNHGVFMGKWISRDTLECHASLLPEARGKGIFIARQAMRYIFKNYNKLNRLLVTFPSNYGTIQSFAEAAKFRETSPQESQNITLEFQKKDL